MSQQNSSKPVKSFSASGIEVSIWRQEGSKNGHAVIRHSVKIRKQYKNDKGEWKNSDYFWPEELAKLRSLVRKAYDYIVVKESEEAEESVPV